MSKFPTEEQAKVLNNDKERAIVSASAGTGKTTTLIQYIADLVKTGVPVSRMLVVTFTNNAANEMKERLLSKLMEYPSDEWILEQIDDVLTADISTMHAFLQKIVKRNIDKLAISSDYYLLDENKSQEIRNRAFDNAYELACEKEDLQELLLSLHSQKAMLRSVVFALEKHFSVLADPKSSIEYYKSHQDEIYNLATSRMNKMLVDRVFSYTQRVAKIFSQMDENSLNYKYIKNYISELQTITSENTLKENILAIRNLSLGKINNKEEIIGFAAVKDAVAKLVKKYRDPQFDNESYWMPNILVQNIYDFYNLYSSELEKIKGVENCLDFNDLEKYSMELLQDSNVVAEIQNNFDYVIIDEYQDTNPVQEKIMKVLAEKCKFLAVGDPKQGIYGFRNATSEIMKKDIRDFSEKGGVYYLTSNFRSDPLILKFVNEVFGKIMQESSTGIDYKATSTFKVDDNDRYPKGELPVVRIDALDIQEEKEEEESPALYDITKAERVVKDNSKAEAEVVAKRINELLLSKIYDARKGAFREVNYSDITILVRGRGAVSDKIIQELSIQEIPVVSSLDKEISSNEEVEVIKSLLKLCVDYEDDVSLAGFLSSKLGGLSLDELYEIRKDAKNKAFYEEFKESNKFAEFNSKIERFKLNVIAKGIRSALEELFAQSNYNAYLLKKKDGINIKTQIDKLLDIIENSSYNYDIPSLLKYLNSNDIRISGANSGLNAVTITTIHASKGLEYPIVILAGMGKDLTRKDSRNGGSSFKISNDYGLALATFDYDEGEKSKNILLTAIDQEKARREFVDEIMLLYVAMTRAKNHLYIVGEEKLDKIKEMITSEDIFENKSFMKLILSALLSKNKSLFDKDTFITEEFEFNKITEIKRVEAKEESKIVKSDLEFEKRIKDYLDFSYPFKNATEMRYKQSVTSINLEESKRKFSGGGESAEVGTAYHAALEKLDILNINSQEDIKNNLSKDILELVDTGILLKNINLLKPFVKDKNIFKEKVFTMRVKAAEIMDTDSDENIMIQGIVDLFLIGEKNILIDYKFTTIKDEKILINKYKKQLIIYKKAIENAYMLHLDEIYLLSLKYGELIKIN